MRNGRDSWRTAIGWFCHSVLLIAAAIWLAALFSIGLAEVLNTVCERNGSRSMVCEGIKGGLLSK